MWPEDIVGDDLAKVMLYCKGFDVQKRLQIAIVQQNILDRCSNMFKKT